MAQILALATAVPDHCFKQQDIAEAMIQGLKLSPDQGENLKTLYDNTHIETRYSVLNNFDIIYQNFTSKQRNEIYKKEAPKLAIQAAKKALDLWKQDPHSITHIISISCTGMMAPGIEYYLIQALNLRPSIARLGINFMGCFGAFNGLSAAKAIVKENPQHRVLVVCTELCCLHGQTSCSHDAFLSNALFADGAAACIIGGDSSDKPLFEIAKRTSLLIPNTEQAMTWDIGDSGFAMKLSSRVPVLVKRKLLPFVKQLIDQHCQLDECAWAIHPGGKSILQGIEQACGLTSLQTAASWEVLNNYGNMSSATFLFVLDRCLNQQKKWTIGLGFGPGLAVEGVLLRNNHHVS